MTRIDDRSIALNSIINDITKKRQQEGSINPDPQNLPGGLLPDVQNFKFVPRGRQTKPDTPPRVLQQQTPMPANNMPMQQQPGQNMPQQPQMPPQPPQQQQPGTLAPPPQQMPTRMANDLLFATGIIDKLIEKINNPQKICLIIKEACKNNNFIKLGFIKLANVTPNYYVKQLLLRALA